MRESVDYWESCDYGRGFIFLRQARGQRRYCEDCVGQWDRQKGWVEPRISCLQAQGLDGGGTSPHSEPQGKRTIMSSGLRSLDRLGEEGDQVSGGVGKAGRD